jgi:hypothetical protein
MQLTVNRYLKDKAFDRIDHALGRPIDPLGETYRSYFAVDTESKTARSFRASAFWREGRTSDGMAWFYVTDKGRAALRDHLKAIGDPHRAYAVYFEGEARSVIATSPAKAKYSRWLDLSDCYPDLTFAQFQKSARVRLA